VGKKTNNYNPSACDSLTLQKAISQEQLHYNERCLVLVSIQIC